MSYTFNTTTWDGRISGSTSIRKFRGYVDYELTYTETDVTISVLSAGIEKVSGGSCAFESSRNVAISNSETADTISVRKTATYKYNATNPYREQLASSGSITLPRQVEDYEITITLSAAKTGGDAFKGSASGLFTITIDGTDPTPPPVGSDQYLNLDGLAYFWSKIVSALTGKQNTLVSGSNIKTINNQDILGSGNITISGGGGGIVRDLLWSQNPVSTSASTKTLSNAITNYDVIQVVFVDQASDLTYRIVEVPALVGAMGVVNAIWNLSSTSNIFFLRRAFTLAESSIDFTNGEYKNSASMTTARTNAGYLIPVEVYGVQY